MLGRDVGSLTVKSFIRKSALQVQKDSAAAGLHIRTSCVCNPGACYNYLGIKPEDIHSIESAKLGCNDDIEWVTVKGTYLYTIFQCIQKASTNNVKQIKP